MGLLSSILGGGKSSTQANTTSSATDNSTNSSGNYGYIASGGASINVTDGGATSAALEAMLRSQVDSNDTLSNNLLAGFNFTSDVQENSNKFYQAALAGTQNLSQAAVQQASDLSMQAQQGQNTTLITNVAKYGVLALVCVGAIVAAIVINKQSK